MPPLGTGRIAAPLCVLSPPGPRPHPIRWDKKRYSLNAVCNKGLIAFLKIWETLVKGTKKLKDPHLSEHFGKKGRLFLLIESK